MTELRPAVVLALLSAFGCGAEKAPAPVAPSCPLELPPPLETTTPAPTQELALTDESGRLGYAIADAFGVSLVDFDQDGWPDVTVVRSADVLRLRNREGVFEPFCGTLDVPQAEGLAWADVDGDADLDLVVTSAGATTRLWLNDGAGGLRDVTQDHGLSGSGVAKGATFFDLEGDGDLDLYICQGADGTPPDRAGPGEDRVPRGRQGAPNWVLRNDGAGRFEPVVGTPLVGSPRGESFMAALFDIDEDGDDDMFVAQDFAADQFFERTEGGWAEAAHRIPADVTGVMGVAVADLDGDGRLDFYGTNSFSDRVYLNRNGVLTDVWSEALVGPDPTAAINGWGVALADLDNDGDPDVVATGAYQFGFGQNEPGADSFRPGGAYVLRHGGDPLRFEDVTEAAAPVLAPAVDGWGLAVGDIDRDGRQDVLIGINGYDVPPGQGDHRATLLLRNTSAVAAERGWLALAVRQPGTSNVFAVGARVTVRWAGRTASQTVAAGTSYVSQHADRLHFGLGDSDRAQEVEIRWPDGVIQRWTDLPTGEHDLSR